MLRVTADTNIYVSALNFSSGKPRRLLNLAEAGSVRLITSDAILDELAKTLRGKKFAWPEARIDDALNELAWFTERVTPTRTVEIIKADPSDNRILECAEAGNADYIVTGDEKHILPLGSFQGKPILRVADFLRQLEGPSQPIQRS